MCSLCQKKLTLITIFFLFCRYLHEIGYTDTIIDVRSAKVRSLLGLQPHNTDSDAECTQPALINGEQPSKPRPADDETDAKRYLNSCFPQIQTCLLSIIGFVPFIKQINVCKTILDAVHRKCHMKKDPPHKKINK